ncbi:cellulase family glycosylhydrolase [Mariniflexile sp. HMF6888]|uniref:cellulase family glycosylhydrolase n=1 Tax=Mariniflexile sp. HMF6888 TaxID=3373086 RepID=UPI003794DFDE
MKKTNRKLFAITLMVFALIGFWACSKDNSTEDDTGDLRAAKGRKILTVSSSSLHFQEGESSQEISITTNIDAWTISNNANWITLSQTSGIAGTTAITVTVSENTDASERSANITISANQFKSQNILVTQANGALYPSYNTNPIPADATGMSSNAVELAAKMKLGWNIGNTLEAIGGENAWGNPNITKEYVTAVKNLGFNAIRLPCAWDQYADQTTAKIDEAWMNRVKEVLQYCVDNDMYVLLNIHWDGGWLENNCTPEKKESVNAKQKAFWEQIATAMRDFDEHIMFASANEPGIENAVEMDVLHSYHQTFVNTVRSTGGRNSYRVLVMQGPSTNIEKSNDLMNMPTDEVEGRMMAEVHFYSPSQFCILLDGDASWGKMFYYWGAGHHSTIEPDRNATWGEEDAVDVSMSIAKAKFIDNGIPVILGEYGAYRRDNSQYVPQDLETHNDAVDYWITYVTKQALANGLIPFWWDTGGSLDRNNFTVKDQRTIDAIIAGGN